MRKLIVLAMALVLVASAIGAAYAPRPAEAATRVRVYVVVNNSACSPVGQNLSIRNFNAANVQETSWTVVNESGDNIVYPEVLLNRTNHFYAVVDCYKKLWWGWQHVGKREIWGSFYPTGWNQTFWLG